MTDGKHKKIWYFFRSMAISLILFFAMTIPEFLPLPSDDIAADIPYTSAGYNLKKSSFLLLVADLPVDFAVNIDSSYGVNVFCFPKAAIKNSRPDYAESDPKKRAALFGKNCKRMVELTVDNLKTLTDHVGGITANTPYGLPSPSGNGVTIALDEKLHFYGSSLVAILKKESNPDKKRMVYYGELVARITLGFLKRYDKENYLFLKSISKTDISYTDYYDYAPFFVTMGDNVTSDAPDGVWIAENYYLY